LPKFDNLDLLRTYSIKKSQSKFPVGGASFDAAKLEVAIVATINVLAGGFQGHASEIERTVSLSVPRAAARQWPWWR
jgi:hypothetical protein